MFGNDWKDSVFSDGTALFLSNPQPTLHESVSVRVRIFRDSPVRAVYVKLLRNGMQVMLSTRITKQDERFAYYEAQFEMTQPRMQYQFILRTEERLYFYTQKGLQEDLQDLQHDFVVMSDYLQPAWVKDAIFYQIFPERFCNGDPSCSVRDGEYQVNGFAASQVLDWNTPAAPYEQAHCADFYGGDLIGIRQKIPYLKKLGVTALYLNPIFLAPSVHKYDCIDYLQVDPHFGGDQALAELSAALHKNGMRLILDISINHTGTAHRWFNKDTLYFDPSVGAWHNPKAPERAYYMIHEDGSYECWDGVSSLPKLNFASDQLRDVLYRAEDSVLKKWLKPPYNIDGWRFDVADVMANFNEQQLADEVWPEIRQSIREVSPQAYILAEHWDDCTKYLQGDCWDAPMNYYGFGRIIRQFYGAPDPFWERDDRLWPYSGHLSAQAFRERVEGYLSRIPFALWQNQYNLYDSHDIGRFHVYPGITEQKYRGAVIALFTMIGLPSIYYGDEAGIGGKIGFFEGGRYPMPWDSPFEESPVFCLHQTLARLRKEHPVFARGSFRFLYAREQVLAFARFDENEKYITILSASNEQTSLRLDLKLIDAKQICREVLESVLEYQMEENEIVRITLPPQGSCLLQCDDKCSVLPPASVI